MKKIIRKYTLASLQTKLRKLYYGFPILRKIYYFPQDLVRYCFKKSDSLIPPRSKIFVGDSDFEKTGCEFLDHFVKHGGLKPDHKVLEVGSGIGRMAIPLTKYLNSNGSYDGIDIVREGVKWCQKKITPKFSGFTFHISDIYNDLYNREGTCQASNYKFPFDDKTFDFVFLTSVFTHMIPKEVKNYLFEINRVLKNGGTSFITFFILDESAWDYVKTGQSRFNFEYEDCRVIDPKIPGASIAFDEKKILEYYSDIGLQIEDPILYGKWAGREKYVSYQDIIISKRI